MLTDKVNKKSNCNIAQLKNIFSVDPTTMEDIIPNIVARNVDCQVVATNYLESHHPEWIGCTALYFAAHHSNTTAIDILLSLGANFTIKNSNGSTTLHQIVEKNSDLISEACKYDDNIVHSILSAHIKYNNFENPLNRSGLSHFHIACATNNVEVVKGFLQNGVSVNHAVKTDSLLFPGYTPLHFTAKFSAYKVTEILLSHRANFRVKDAQNMMPLHLALKKKLITVQFYFPNIVLKDNNEKILELLLEKESNNGSMVIDEWGLSHFHVASTLLDSKILENYLQKQVNINETVNIDSPIWAGYTALHFATLSNVDSKKLLVTMLVTKGADINMKNSEEITPLDICTKQFTMKTIHAILSSSIHYKDIKLSDGKTKLTDLVYAMRNLDQFNAFFKKLNSDVSISNLPLWQGYSAMHLVVIFSEKPMTIFDLSRNNANKILQNICENYPGMINTPDTNGCTPLHLAFHLDKTLVFEPLFKFLTSYTNLVDCIDGYGLSYIHIASAKNYTHLLKRLLATGMNVSAIYKSKPSFSSVTYSGSTALHFAVLNGNVEAAKILMKHGADVYAKDANHMTPIHLLLSTENDDCRDQMRNILLSSPNLKNVVVPDVGLNHLHVACLYGKLEHVELLLNNGVDINQVITHTSKKDNIKLIFLEKYASSSPLVLAYRNKRYDIVKLLLQRGASILENNSQEMACFYETIKNCSKSFVEIWKISTDLQDRLKKVTGMTELHIACFDWTITKIEKLLHEGANANAQLYLDSPIFQGYTPLHILMQLSQHINQDDLNKIIKLFLKFGANVTLQNGKLETVVHMVYTAFNKSGDKITYQHANILLEAHRNFRVNPRNVKGISHFHIACSLCNMRVVEKFLSQYDVDINQPIDYFSPELAGYTALHLVAESKLLEIGKKLRIVDLLLNHGANVEATDAQGNTPLHKCATFALLDLYDGLIRNGADVNIENVYGNTPLYCYLKNKDVTIEGLKALLRFGSHFNKFDATSAYNNGYLATMTSKIPHERMQSLLMVAVMNFKNQIEADNLGRTVIHNLVSTNFLPIAGRQYTELIETLTLIDCDIDSQENLGRTPLHVAVLYGNFKAVCGLLLAGADVNISDNNGEIAFSIDFDHYIDCECSSDDEENGYKRFCENIQIIRSFAIHVKKLQVCGLDVSKKNGDLACKTFEKFKDEMIVSEEFFKELETLKNTNIEPHSLTLYDFLSENKAVADYPTMSEVKRDDIIEFFSASEIKLFREKFPELSGILQFQYRKARARPQLVESAKDAMNLLIGGHLPEICSLLIMIFLTNAELKNLIASAVI